MIYILDGIQSDNCISGFMNQERMDAILQMTVLAI